MSMTRGSRFGAYEIGALIGVGGMGEVYRATDTTLKRDVALKVLPESLVTDANRLARLQREAEVLASLNHPNVAHIYGLERSDGRSALVMELVDGVTLAERIGQGQLPPSEALDVALQIAAGLEAAHDRGIVHRDLKPANIKLTTHGAVKVLDFGIAKAPDGRSMSGTQPPALTTPAMTEIGLVLGTAAYMAPEQARGKPVDKRADVWAFGCVLYEMLTGRAAFLGDDVTTTLARVLERDPDLKALPSGLAPAVQHTLDLCLQKDPRKRLRDIGDVRLALEGGLVARAAVPKPLWRRALPVAAALSVGALAAGGYVATLAPPATPAVVSAALPVTRFVVTPPASAPLANLGGTDVTISPDGQRIAYFAETELGVVVLHVRELDGLEARPVPGSVVRSPGGGNMNPFFSPDGRSIGVYLPDRGVTRLALSGTPPLEVVDGPWLPAFLGATWNSDGTLVYSTGRSLHRISAGGDGTPERLTPEFEGAFLASPMVLPGGRAVLYGFIEGGTERVTVLDLETNESKALFEGQNATYVSTGHIVFARGTTLMAAPFDPKEVAVTGEAVAMLENVRHPSSVTAADYAVSATGTLVYVPSDGDAGGRAAVVWVDRTGNVAGRAVSDLIENPRDPRLSPDGTQLFLTTGLIPESDIWSYDLGGRPPLPLAVTGNNRNGVVSPDGRQMIFGVYLGDTDLPELHTLPTDGSVLVPQPLRADPLFGSARVWSAAGELFFVDVRGGIPDILVTPAAASGEVREVVATEYAEFDPALSPNGRWLAYTSDRSGQSEIWVMGYPGGVPVRVSGAGGFEPRWSADGRELYYLQGSALMMIAVETEREFSFAPPVQLFSGRYLADPAGASSYDVAPDGRFIMIERGGNASDSASIVVVQNWFEELKRRVPAN